jgi:plasmid stability protein
MQTLALNLDDDLIAALDAVSATQGRDKATLVTDILRKYVEAERLRNALQDPELAKLYERLSAEDLALAEEGMAEYQKILSEADDA